MIWVIIAYATLLVVSIGACMCSVWCYRTCSPRCNHRPFVLPIFVSFGWVVIATQGLLSQTPIIDLTVPDPSSIIMGFISILAALIPLKGASS